MKLYMKPVTSFCFLIVLMAVVLVAGRRQETKEKALASMPSCSTVVGEQLAFNIEKSVKSAAASLMLQSTDGGLTWQDISQRLPEQEQPEIVLMGESDLYIRSHGMIYHSKSNLETPIWEKVNAPDLESKSVVSSRSGLMAFNYEGEILKQTSSGKWVPVFENFKKLGLLTMLETSDGTLFFGYDRNRGLYKSTDRGQSWKQVLHEGWTSEMVESKGVLIATGAKGIMRSTDNGETWEWVISEGGVGIEVERIDSGFAAIVYNTKTQSRTIHISFDGGKTWRAIHDGLPSSMTITSIKQMSSYLIVSHPDGIFRSSDMGKNWVRVYGAPDQFMFASLRLDNTQPVRDTRRVYSIYASGVTLYAVLGNSGC